MTPVIRDLENRLVMPMVKNVKVFLYVCEMPRALSLKPGVYRKD